MEAGHNDMVTMIIMKSCELSFNRDLVPCSRAFDMSNKYYLLTYLLIVHRGTRLQPDERTGA